MYTSFPNTPTKAVSALENGPGIPIGEIWKCHFMVKKWKKTTTTTTTKNEKKLGAMKKKKKKKRGVDSLHVYICWVA